MTSTAKDKKAPVPPPENTEKGLIRDYSKLTNFVGTHEELGVIRKSVCKDLNDGEFLHFLNYCAEVKLHPLLKQVWVYRKKDWTDRGGNLHRGEMVMFTGRDGFYTNAERHPDYEGYRSAAVYENDFFEVNFNDKNDPIIHTAKGFDRGRLLGAYSICYRKGCYPYPSILRLEDFSKKKPAKNAASQQQKADEDEAKGKQSAWDTNEMDMIIIRAEAKAFKKQFGISGMQDENDWRKNADGSVSPINRNEDKTEETEEELLLAATEELFEVWKESKHKEKDIIKKDILSEQESGNLTFERISELKEILSEPKQRYNPEQ